LESALERVHRDTGYDLSAASVRVGFTRGHLMDLVIRSAAFALAGSAADSAACERLVTLLLGAECRAAWVGSITSVPGPKPSSLRMVGRDDDRFHPIATLSETIEGGIAGIHGGLDERPYHRFCEQAGWTLLDVEPHATDAECLAQDDLALCSTMLPEMLKCFLQGQPFSSVRFSRNSEIFCYLKYRSDQRTSEVRLAERLALEDALNRALVPGGVGCVVGSGLGLHYSYVDLALTDLDHGAELCARVFEKSAIEGPCWLLFCDSKWSDVWAPLTEDQQSPPGLSSTHAPSESRSNN